MSLPRLTIARLVRRATRGVHRPAVVRASDGHDYALKLGDRDPDFPACELVAAMLAGAFDVETPPFALVEVSPEIRAFIVAQGPAWADLAMPQPGGVCFGTRWIEGATPWSAGLAGVVADRASIARLFAFDVFIENGDRQPQNPNVLLVGSRLVAIDHGQALPAVQGLGYIGPFGHAEHVAWPILAAGPGDLTVLADRAPSDDEIDRAIDVVPAGWWGDASRPSFARQALRRRRASYRATLRGLSAP